MSTVYEAVHKEIGRRVALKVLRPLLASDPDLTARFFNEARAANVVDHPAIVQISDYGQLPDGTAYLVMELLRGETLGQRLANQRARFPLAEVLRIARQVAVALSAAHERGIVHRDLKPDNLMFVPDPDLDQPERERLKILDFGIAKVAKEALGTHITRTRTGVIFGTVKIIRSSRRYGLLCRGQKARTKSG